MKQVFISGKGEISVQDSPVPGRLKNSLLVQNGFSIISSGTEGAAVSEKGGWMGVLDKALKSRKQVEQVWELAKSQGINSTLKLVKGKLDDYRMLGYSTAGIVIETDGAVDLKTGDRVACMGVGFANHAEFSVIPNNLAVKIPDNVKLEDAAFGAIACIALQGLRVLDLSPGERVMIIGLGLVGALAAHLAKAMGYEVYGADISDQRAKFVADSVGIKTWNLTTVDLSSIINNETSGNGVDAVAICAASKSDAPVNMAFDLCRKKGKISIVGDVGLGLNRAKMFKKELSLHMSTSYGPGRYDENYEIKGQDYPYGYVRWTERRNLEYFLTLLANGRMDISSLRSLKFPIKDAGQAYKSIKKGDPDTYGVLIDYDVQEDMPKPFYSQDRILKVGKTIKLHEGQIGIGLIGCGGFAKTIHLPNLKKLSPLFSVRSVSTKTGASAAVIARKNDIPLATSDNSAILEDENIQAVIISTRHADHASEAITALKAGKHVFIEKPMCLSVEEGREVERLAEEASLVVRVGFNRRFSPLINKMKNIIGNCGHRIFTIRVSIGGSGGNHWSNTIEEGGRFLGEGVHFLDLSNWFMNQYPQSVTAVYIGEENTLNPNLSVTVKYPDGSIANIVYTTHGNSGIGKEFYEAFGNGKAVRCDDFVTLDVSPHKVKIKSNEKRNKGQLEELEEFAHVIKGIPSQIVGADARAGWITTWMVDAALKSAQENRTMFFNDVS